MKSPLLILLGLASVALADTRIPTYKVETNIIEAPAHLKLTTDLSSLAKNPSVSIVTPLSLEARAGTNPTSAITRQIEVSGHPPQEVGLYLSLSIQPGPATIDYKGECRIVEPTEMPSPSATTLPTLRRISIPLKGTATPGQPQLIPAGNHGTPGKTLTVWLKITPIEY